MPYTKREWKDEVLTEDPRYKITLSTEEVLDQKARIELNVDTTLEGTPFEASIMNDMENRIGAAIDFIENSLDTSLGSISANLTNRINTLDSTTVKLTGAQTISGVKTFSALPISGSNPTADNQLARKAYVDSTVTAAVNNIRQTVYTANIPNTGWAQSGSFYTRTTGINVPSGTNGNTIDLYIPRASLANLLSWVSVDNVSGVVYISSGAIPNAAITIYVTFKQTT